MKIALFTLGRKSRIKSLVKISKFRTRIVNEVQFTCVVDSANILHMAVASGTAGPVLAGPLFTIGFSRCGHNVPVAIVSFPDPTLSQGKGSGVYRPLSWAC